MKTLFLTIIILLSSIYCHGQAFDFNQFMYLTEIRDIDKLNEIMLANGYFRSPEKIEKAHWGAAMWGKGAIVYDEEKGISQFNNRKPNYELLFKNIWDINYCWMYGSNMLSFEEMKTNAISHGWKEESLEQNDDELKYKYKKEGSDHTLYLIKYSTGRNAYLYQTY